MTTYEFDRAIRDEGFSCICGIDEAGRGPLAGPVFAAAVILNPEDCIEGINDSKKLSEKKREQLFDQICARAVAYAIASASVEEIETFNILQATFLAMRRALEALPLTPELALIDGNRLPPELSVPARCVIKGDALSASIAAASILAKVSRDRYMLKMAEQYPQYAFEKHKGYGTAVHYEALRTYGPSPIHRMSFLKKFYAE